MRSSGAGRPPFEGRRGADLRPQSRRCSSPAGPARRGVLPGSSHPRRPAGRNRAQANRAQAMSGAASETPKPLQAFKTGGGIVIVGASLAGLGAAEALREAGFTGHLTIIGDEPDEPYDRPPLS